MIWKRLYILFFSFIIIEAALNHLAWYEKPIYKITSDTHDRRLIYDFLQETYQKLFSLAPNNHAHLHLSKDDMGSERSCIENTVIKYYLRHLNLITVEHEASECRINLNQKYQSILSPTFNVHEYIHGSSDPLVKSLTRTLIEHLSEHEETSSIVFNQFDTLNYGMQCLIDYQEIVQVKLKEQSVEAVFDKVLEIPESCGFQKIKADFNGEIQEAFKMDMPINGTFYCRKGRTSTCNRSNAEYTNPKYKLLD